MSWFWPFVPTDRRIADLKRQRNFALTENTRLRCENADLVRANDTLRVLVDRHAGIAARYKADAERLERRWAMHTDRCEIARQLDDVDRDKRLENRE
jgi:hypothetical protein